MKRKDILNKVRESVSKIMGGYVDDVNEGDHLINDLGLDSLDFIELIMEVEKEFDILIKDEDAEKSLTVKLFIDLIENEINNQ